MSLSHTAAAEIPQDDVLALSVPEYASYLEKRYNITTIPSDLDTTDRTRMLAGLVYDCMSPRLVLGRQRANDIVAVFNNMNNDSIDIDPTATITAATRERRLREESHKREALIYLLTDGNIGTGCKVDPPLKVDYGNNLILGDSVTIKQNVIILDCARIEIGSQTVIETGAQVYSATHPTNPLLRNVDLGFDYAMPVSIGKECWIGPRAVICPGVAIGDGVVVETGSVVSKNVPAHVVIAGSPAKVVRVLDMAECDKQVQEHERADSSFLGDGQGQDDSSLHEFYQKWRPAPVGTLEIP